MINEINGNKEVKAEKVKKHSWVFVKAIIDNPTFISKTKEGLISTQILLVLHVMFQIHSLEKVRRAAPHVCL